MGETEGTIVEWRTAPGARIARGDVIALVETAKAAAELEAPESGAVVEILVPEGHTVPAGTVVAVIESDE
jgi:pyruvate dehydrogenase E2 component (dihydrolipoamide acetyltransferase)